MQMIFDDVIDRVKEVLKDDKKSLPEIADIIDIKYNTLKFKNSSSLKPEKLIIFAQKYNLNYEWLAFGVGAKYKNQKDIDSNIHKFFDLFGNIGLELSNFQKEIVEATNPDSEAGSIITSQESQRIALVLETLTNKLGDISKLANIDLDFKIEVKN